MRKVFGPLLVVTALMFAYAPVVIARAPLDQDHILVADVDLSAAATSPARRLFLKDRRPEVYAEWFTGTRTAAPSRR